MAMRKKIRIREKDGKFVVDYYDEVGRRPRKRFNTLKEAQAEKAKLEGIAEGFIKLKNLSTSSDEPILSNAKLKEAIKDYVATCVRKDTEHFKRTEKYHFEQLFEYVNNELNIVYLYELKRVHMDKFRAYLIERSLSPSTVNRWFATYKPFFKKCVSWELIAKAPTDGMVRIKEDVIPVRHWTAEQLKEVFNILDYRVLRTVRFLATTGCRPIEICRLNWGDIDLERLQVRFVSHKGNKSSEAFSPLPTSQIEPLKDLYSEARRTFMGRDTDPVFRDPGGRRWTTGRLSKFTREALRTCGINDKSLYGLRHTFCTALTDAGVHPREIQQLARHAKFETTTRYVKRDTTHLRSALNKISGVS